MMAANPNGKVHYAVFHTPGEKWNPNVGFREQDGVGEHVAHYAQLLEQGKLAMGGPFLDNRGGMMVATPDVTAEEIESFAAADPAVHAGLLRYEVVPWYVAMRAES